MCRMCGNLYWKNVYMHFYNHISTSTYACMCKVTVYHCQVCTMLKNTFINTGIWLFYQSCHRTYFLGGRNNEGEKVLFIENGSLKQNFMKCFFPHFSLNFYHFKIYIFFFFPRKRCIFLKVLSKLLKCYSFLFHSSKSSSNAIPLFNFKLCCSVGPAQQECFEPEERI